MKEDVSSVTAMSLAQLPNLHDMHFRNLSDKEPICDMICNIILKERENATRGLNTGALSKLTHVTSENLRRNCESIGFYESFVMLPSMRHLIIKDINSFYNLKQTFTQWPESFSSGLTHLELYMDPLQKRNLSELMSCLQSLQSFSYRLCGERLGFDFGQLISLIQTHLGSTLLHLMLNVGSTPQATYRSGHEIRCKCGGGVRRSTFTKSEKLETLEIQMEMLMDRLEESYGTPRLVDIMSRSLKELRIVESNKAKRLVPNQAKHQIMIPTLESMLKRMGSMKIFALPILETIILSDANSLNLGIVPRCQQLLKDCKENEICLELEDVRTRAEGTAGFCNSCIVKTKNFASQEKF